MNYPIDDGLIPLTELAANLAFSPKKELFDEESYIPIVLLEANLLFADPEFQRLINKGLIKKAKRFDKDLVRPLYVFKRPNGKYSTADGQHEGIIAILYTVQGGKIMLPCQVREHPSHYTLEECLAVEANFFKLLNFRRRNVGKVDKLRADIAIGDELAQEIEQKLIDMNVNIDMIGDPTGVAVYGYDKLMEAHEKYGTSNIHRSIKKYQDLQDDPKAPKWNDIDKPLNGGLIGGLSAIYFLLNGGGDLGFGDKNYALNYYLDNFLKNAKPTGKKSIMSDTGGVTQDILIARRIVDKCNALIENDVINKKDGSSLQVTIGEETMKSAGLGDPSKIDD